MSAFLEPYAWPAARLGEAIESLAGEGGLNPSAERAARGTPDAVARGDEVAVGRWVAAASDAIGAEAHPVHVRYPDLARIVRHGGPTLMRIRGTTPARFLAFLGGRRPMLLASDGGRYRVHAEEIRSALCRFDEAGVEPDVERSLERVLLGGRARERARRALVAERLRHRQLPACWRIRLPPRAGAWALLQAAGVPRRLAILLALRCLELTVWLLSWSLIGKGALADRLERGWLLGWGLLLVTFVPLKAAGSWLSGALSIDAAAVLKRLLMAGGLQLDPDELRGQGVGQLLGRVLDAQSLDDLALSGGLTGISAALELAVGAGILLLVPSETALTVVLAVWLALAALLVWRQVRQRAEAVSRRFTLTHRLVENMVGHRTRLVQQAPSMWHNGEDELLSAYLERLRRADWTQTLLTSAIPRGWLILALGALAPSLVAGAHREAAFVALGGVVLVYRALRAGAAAAGPLLDAVLALRRSADLLRAANRAEPAAAAALAVGGGGPLGKGRASSPLIEARGLAYRHGDRAAPVLSGCDLRIYAGDRLLLTGPSGGGKSTLAALLAGLRRPQAGQLLLHGLDRFSLGRDAWRWRVVLAPQFHENFVFTGTLAFNLLVGRRWPATTEDLREAERLCAALGLEDLLRRMPAGMQQVVGETGWQLSHGERSRVFLARALLQGAHLIVLDESFGALDPIALQQSLRTAIEAAPALVVIAHP